MSPPERARRKHSSRLSDVWRARLIACSLRRGDAALAKRHALGIRGTAVRIGELQGKGLADGLGSPVRRREMRNGSARISSPPKDMTPAREAGPGLMPRARRTYSSTSSNMSGPTPQTGQT